MQTLKMAVLVGTVTLLGSLPAVASSMQTLLGGAAAEAPVLVADGCGPGFHRGYYGHCRPSYYRGGYREGYGRGYGYGDGYGYRHRGDWERHWGF